MNPANANAYFNRGCCYDGMKELELAIADYSRALELDGTGANGAKGAEEMGPD